MYIVEATRGILVANNTTDLVMASPLTSDVAPANGAGRSKTFSTRGNARVLPPGLDEATFERVCDLVSGVIGEENVSRTSSHGCLDGPNGEKYYGDHYEMRAPNRNTPAGAFRPETLVANEYKVPLWTFSRGKNLGYGSSTGIEKGTVMLDLHRMNKIIEVNEDYGYAIVEPGVSFFDLFEYIKKKELKLWISVPAIGWGSVLGNTTERGFGYTAYGEHSQQQCGMEVVLPTGEIIRSGMGALEGSEMWPLFKGGYGPSIDGLFFQSNLGVVTKIGIHVQSAPHHCLDCQVSVPNEEDLPVLSSTVARLMRSKILQNHSTISNLFRQAFQDPSTHSPMAAYWVDQKAVPDSMLHEIQQEKGLGYWMSEFALYGSKAICDAAWKEVQEAFKGVSGVKFKATAHSNTSGPGPLVASEMERLMIPHNGYPTMEPLKMMDYRGTPGGHTCFSPLFPPDGKALYQYWLRSKKIVEAANIDYFSDFHVYGRYTIAIIVLVYGPGDGPKMDRLYKELLEDANKEGVSEYRTHIDYMDDIADHYNFNDGAQRKFLQKIKDVTDPNGILSQGKSGIWNAGHKKTTA
ncbi:hypothetical protein N7490_001909 [Penicillium lividum]|nr:hypothetical protein N7490_001909 [Penicillium lividum]